MTIHVKREVLSKSHISTIASLSCQEFKDTEE
jgi:hypothetical protein